MKLAMVSLLALLLTFTAFANQEDTSLLGQVGIDQVRQPVPPPSNEIDDFGPLHPPVLQIQFNEGPQNHMFGIAWDGQYYWTINGGNSNGLLNRYDVNGNYLGTTNVTIDGRGIVFNPVDNKLYISSYQGHIYRIDNPFADYATTQVGTSIMQNGQASLGMSWDGNLLYDFSQGTCIVRDFWTFATVTTFYGLSYGSGNFGGECAIVADTDYLYTMNTNTNTIYVYNINDGTYVTSYVLPYGDNGMSPSMANYMIFYSTDSNYATGTWYGYSLRDWIDDVTLTLTPVVDMVPPPGGNVVYDGHLVSTLPITYPGLRYQTFVTDPMGGIHGPIDNIPFTLTPFMNVTVTGMTVYVPGGAPPGPYILEGKAGVPYTPPLQRTDSFPFIKTAGGWFEDFNDGLAQGMIFHTGSGSHTINGGYCKIDVTTASPDWGSGAYTGMNYNNFAATTTFEYVQTIGYSVGMLFCGDGPQDGDYNGYAVYLSNTSYSAWLYSAGSPSNLLAWTTGASINTGVGAINTLQIDGISGTYDITVNGTYLGSFTDYTYTGGLVGMVCAYTNETWFDAIGANPVPSPNAMRPVAIGEVEVEYRDHMGLPTAPYDRGVAFDRSGEFVMDSFEFDPEDWVGNGKFITSDNPEASVPAEFAIGNAYPNPFNPSTSISVFLAETSDLTVQVYNIAGQLVTTLADGSYMAGQHTLTFDATYLASGVYFVHAVVPGHIDQVQKVMLVR